MKKEFNPSIRILALSQNYVMTTSVAESLGGGEGKGTPEKPVEITGAPGRANSIIAGVADQK